MTISRILQAAASQRWALEESFYGRMCAVIARSVVPTDAELVAAAGGRAADRIEVIDPELPQRRPLQVQRGVATIPIHGVISQRATLFEDVCADGTSVETIRGLLQQAMSRDDVHAIVLDIDSPGGSVAGIDDLGAELREARAKKPIVAHTDHLMASAAYWLASQANKVFATRDAIVGSIGVIAGVIDNHRQLQERGLDPVVVKSVPGKGHLQSNGAFGDAQRAAVQRDVDAYHAMFVEAVAAGRGVPLEQAQHMGDGSTWIGAQAQQRGFIDGVQTMQASLRVARSLARQVSAAAAAVLGDEDAPAAPTNLPPAGNVAAQASTTTEDPMDPKTLTGAGGTPPPANPAATQHDPAAITSAAEAARNAERQRVLAIRKAGARAQADLVDRLISDGTPVEQALAAIAEDLSAQLQNARALPSAQTAPQAVGNSAAVLPQAKPADAIAAMPEGEAKWQAQWDADAALRAEFGGNRDMWFASARNAGRARLTSNRKDIGDVSRFQGGS